MFRTNRLRKKKLLLTFSSTRKLSYLLRIIIFLMCFSLVLILFLGIWTNIKQEKLKNKLFGLWDTVFLNVDKDAINYFNEHVFVDNFSVQKIYNKVFLQGDTRVVIGSTDESFFKLGNVDILYGRMPIKKGEVAIEEEYLNILEVERVGDVIPNDSKVEMLRGYSVCGIVENYSSRWKTVNWDVKYINCFVQSSTEAEINLYVQASEDIIRDIKINEIYYKDNLKYDCKYFKESLLNFIELWFILLILLVVVFLLRINFYNHHIKKRLSNCRSSIKVVKNNISERFIIFSYVILSLLLSFYYIDNLICKMHYISSFNAFENNQKILSFSLENNGTLKYIIFQNHDSNNYIIKEIQEIQSKNFNIFISFLLAFITCIFINVLICIFDAYYFEHRVNKNRSFILVHNYYYGIKRIYFLHLIKVYLIKVVAEIIMFVIIFLIKNKDLTYNFEKNLSGLFGLENIILFIILRIFVIYLYISYRNKKISINEEYLLQ